MKMHLNTILISSIGFASVIFGHRLQRIQPGAYKPATKTVANLVGQEAVLGPTPTPTQLSCTPPLVPLTVTYGCDEITYSTSCGTPISCGPTSFSVVGICDNSECVICTDCVDAGDRMYSTTCSFGGIATYTETLFSGTLPNGQSTIVEGKLPLYHPPSLFCFILVK
jgi:hypothetical protein